MLVRATLPWPPQLNRGRRCAFWMPDLDSIQLPEMDPDSWPTESVCGLSVYVTVLYEDEEVSVGRRGGGLWREERTHVLVPRLSPRKRVRETLWRRFLDVTWHSVHDSCVPIPYFGARFKRKTGKRALVTSIPWRHVAFLRRRSMTLASLYRTLRLLLKRTVLREACWRRFRDVTWVYVVVDSSQLIS